MRTVRTEAAVIRGTGREWEIVELDLDPPAPREVRVRMLVAGLCHSDEHLRHLPAGTLPVRYPMVGGHEGAGVVEEVGEGVTRVRPGDHVVCSSVPACGTCRRCGQGRQNLCELGGNGLDGALYTPAGGYRFHADGQDFGGMSYLGTFARYAVVAEASLVPVGPDIPFEAAALIGCSVLTGWGTVVRAAEVRPDETVVIYGIGGSGVHAVQGARWAGARHIVAVDPVASRRDTAEELGATHTAADAEQAHRIVAQLTAGRLADHCVVLVGTVTPEVVSRAVDVIGRGGTVTLAGIGDPTENTVQLNGTLLALRHKRLQGALFGGVNTLTDVPLIVDLYRRGEIQLDSLVSGRYRLADISEGYRRLHGGHGVRHLIVHEHDPA
ncbi:NDMA-dependent alcohol dehydrogenase [Actinoallomurus iriomotensis]|uniref:Alcohol dehydrogenase D n=1 Tax=Actinoallomurus iriomotensis TaxID=478107 RepID=A0A9W6VNZ0_9ACTN|nr:NDMA-dependent alcohol dehydrogenase [Actinoallomurus iriomotensis]GLY73942.1 putative alcohol dehydrogenase D [Actinoallomurus iriomotensis]